jgi:hypothetical protein
LDVATLGLTAGEEDEHLGLVEIGDVAVLVDATAEVARPGALAAPARDEAEEKIVAINRDLADLEDCEPGFDEVNLYTGTRAHSRAWRA